MHRNSGIDGFVTLIPSLCLLPPPPFRSQTDGEGTTNTEGGRGGDVSFTKTSQPSIEDLSGGLVTHKTGSVSAQNRYFYFLSFRWIFVRFFFFFSLFLMVSIRWRPGDEAVADCQKHSRPAAKPGGDHVQPAGNSGHTQVEKNPKQFPAGFYLWLTVDPNYSAFN